MVSLQQSKEMFMQKLAAALNAAVDDLETLSVNERESAKDLGEKLAKQHNLPAQVLTASVTAMIARSSDFQSKVGRNGGIVRVTKSEVSSLEESPLLNQEMQAETESQVAVAV